MELVLTTQEPVIHRIGIEAWREELDLYYMEMAKFESMDLEDIFTHLAGYSARVSGIRSQIVRSTRRDITAFRQQEIDPFIDECDRQFKIWSRVHTVRAQDWEMTKVMT